MLFVAVLLHKFIAQNNLYLNNADFLSRVYQNDFYVNSLNYVWTSFWYLPSYVLLTITVFVYTHLRGVTALGVSFVLFLFVYVSTLLDYNSFNPTPFLEYSRAEHVNTLLTNSVNKYHPFIFYNTVAGTLLCWLYAYCTPARTKFGTQSVLLRSFSTAASNYL